MVRRAKTKRSFKEQYLAWWDIHWADAKLYKYGWIATYRHMHEGFPVTPTLNPLPKLRKNQFYPKEYPFYSKHPKWWNKCFHIRPNRRAWKRFCRKASNLHYSCYEECKHQQWNGEGCIWDHWDSVKMCHDSECRKALEHSSEGIPYPSSKNHEYYY